MKDDIKTLREFIKSRQNGDTHYGDMAFNNQKDNALAALERISSRLANLQRCAVQGQEMAKEQMDKCVAAERERDCLRAMLDKAIEALHKINRL